MPILIRTVGLPLALMLGMVAGLGCYYEANDDASLAWLFSGVAAAGPAPAVALYFHGYARALAAAYTAMPGVPWLGGLLGGLLGGATLLVFATLDRLLRPCLRPAQVGLALVVFFGVAYLENWLWFSYVRVALLLAGGAVLFAAQRPGRRGALAVGLVGVVAAWLLRPSLAWLAVGAVLPAAIVLAGGLRRAAPLLLGTGLVLGGATAVSLATRSAADAHVRALDNYSAQVHDYNQLLPVPRTAPDSLAVAATSQWILGDSALINPAFYHRAYRFDAAVFLTRTVPAKLAERLGLLVRDYFPLLGALLLSWLVGARPGRRGFWVMQAGYAGALLALAGLLKLPPRLALPLLDFWLLTNVVFLLKLPAAGAGPRWVHRPWGRGALALSASALVLLYAAKTWHRYQVLSSEQRRHEQTLAEISRRTAGQVRILAGATELLKSLSPFRAHSLGPGPVVVLTGWPTREAAQYRLYRALTGTADQAAALRYLAQRPPGTVAWVLAPEAAGWLNAAARQAPARPAYYWRPGPALATDASLRFYQPGVGL